MITSIGDGSMHFSISAQVDEILLEHFLDIQQFQPSELCPISPYSFLYCFYEPHKKNHIYSRPLSIRVVKKKEYPAQAFFISFSPLLSRGTVYFSFFYISCYIVVLFPVFALVLRKNTTCELLGRRLTDPQKCHVFFSSFESKSYDGHCYVLDLRNLDGRKLLEGSSPFPESNGSVS